MNTPTTRATITVNASYSLNDMTTIAMQARGGLRCP